jgi:hypothetical protein
MRSGLYSPSEIGRHLGLHCCTVSRIGQGEAQHHAKCKT